MRPNAVPTTKNLKPSPRWEKIRTGFVQQNDYNTVYIYINNIYIYILTINILDQLQHRFMPMNLCVCVCLFSVYNHNMINAVNICAIMINYDYILLSSWKLMNISREVPEIWKKLSIHMLCRLTCTLIIKLSSKKTRSLHSSLHGLPTETFELWSGEIRWNWSNLDKVS